MRWRGKRSLGVLVIGIVAVWGWGLPAGTSPGAAQASAAVAMPAAQGGSGSAKAVPTPTGKPAFDATFHGTHLNTNVWDTCYPLLKSYNGGCKNWGNREEAEWYQPSQVKVSGGVVRLTARRERTVGTTSTGAQEVYDCRSGMITSYPGFKFEYGFVQVVANIPHSNGLWPALWLGAANGKYPPEIDMLESWGVKQLTGSFYHPVTGHRSRATYSPKLTVGWHTYSMSWTRSKLAFYVDKKLVLTVTKNVPHQQMYFLADLAEYLPAQRGYCTGQLSIRSVKIWTS
jgi:beta-glucanase (GH16 family)